MEPRCKPGFWVMLNLRSMSKHPVLKLAEHHRREILWHGILVFLATAVLALIGVERIGPLQGYQPSNAISVPYFLVVFFLATLALLFALRLTKRSAIFEVLFTIAVLSGAWFIADIFLSETWALVVGSLVILLRFTWKNVLTMNLTLAIGIAGISAAIGSGLSPNGVLIILTVLAFYDIVAVYKTRHMVRMFRDLVSRGILFAFALTPLHRKQLLAKVDAPGGGALLLGTGDVALPMVLAVSAARTHMAHGIAVVLGASAGFALMYLLFLRQDKRRPMPALPPIALGAILFYFASLILI